MQKHGQNALLSLQVQITYVGYNLSHHRLEVEARVWCASSKPQAEDVPMPRLPAPKAHLHDELAILLLMPVLDVRIVVTRQLKYREHVLYALLLLAHDSYTCNLRALAVGSVLDEVVEALLAAEAQIQPLASLEVLLCLGSDLTRD